MKVRKQMNYIIDLKDVKADSFERIVDVINCEDTTITTYDKVEEIEKIIDEVKTLSKYCAVFGIRTLDKPENPTDDGKWSLEDILRREG